MILQQDSAPLQQHLLQPTSILPVNQSDASSTAESPMSGLVDDPSEMVAGITTNTRTPDLMASRVWTDQDILTLIAAYKKCKRPHSRLSASSHEKMETTENLFERVHAEFVKSALNVHRTPKSLHEKFGFLTQTYRRIKEYQSGNLYEASEGVNWWTLRPKEQRRFLTRSMTPISLLVFQTLESVLEGNDMRSVFPVALRIDNLPQSPPHSSVDVAEPPLLQTFQIALKTDTASLARPQQPPRAHTDSSVPSLNLPISPTPSTTSQLHTPLSPLERQSLSQQPPLPTIHKSVPAQLAANQLRPQLMPRSVSCDISGASSERNVFMQPSYAQQMSLDSPSYLMPLSNFPDLDMASSLQTFDPQSQNGSHVNLGDQINEMAFGSHALLRSVVTTPLDDISVSPNEMPAQFGKRRRIDSENSIPHISHDSFSVGDDMTKMSNDKHHDPILGSDFSSLPSALPEVMSHSSGMSMPSSASFQDSGSPQTQGTQHILQEFVALYKRSVEEQRHRDELLLKTLTSISQMTSSLCQSIAGHQRKFDPGQW
ncbi:uncharacterized protein V1518DRAFT_421170 [Limtongia smithiae]|uniref:uncharacterized protein n=1 Tax=Limtongia smithiae TaxID=1125753 RepID=UPI0034CE2D10